MYIDIYYLYKHIYLCCVLLGIFIVLYSQMGDQNMLSCVNHLPCMTSLLMIPLLPVGQEPLT